MYSAPMPTKSSLRFVTDINPSWWLYERFIRFIDPIENGDATDGLLRGLRNTLAHRRRRGSTMRIGIGSAVLVTQERVTAATDVAPLRPWANDIDCQTLDQRAAYSMQLNVLLAPPDPPFLFVAFGKQTDISRTLRLSVSHDIVELCGEGAMTVRRQPVMEAYHELENVQVGAFLRASRLIYLRQRDPRSAIVQSQIDRLLDKATDGTRRAFEIAEAGPRRQTPEFAALAKLLSARRKATATRKENA
jgi:hypothetical protein